MYGKSMPSFKLFGFSVRIDWSWLIILVLVVWSLAAGVFPARYEGLSGGAYLLMGLVAALGLFASIVVHELCHSLVAQRYGLPMKGITLFLFGGLAEMSDEPPSAKAELLMALAGPAASAVIGGVFLALAWLFAMAQGPAPFIGVLRWIGYINLILVAFNMIPGFPLDGGRVLRAVLWQWKGNLRRATRTASQVGAAFGAVLIGLGFVSLLMLNPIGGLWWILIGMFLRGAARQGYQQVLIRQALEGESVARFMNDQPVTVTPPISLQELVDDYIYRYHFKMFPVVAGDELQGCIATRDIRAVPQAQWSEHQVGEWAVPCSDVNTITPEHDAIDAFRRMVQHHVSRLLVVRDGHLVGILSLKDLLKFLALKLELQGEPDALDVEHTTAQVRALQKESSA